MKYRSAILVTHFLELPCIYANTMVYGVFDRMDLVFDDMERPDEGKYAAEALICYN